MKSRLLLALMVVAGVYAYACGGPSGRRVHLAPETEIMLLYHADTKSEIEECG